MGRARRGAETAASLLRREPFERYAQKGYNKLIYSIALSYKRYQL